MSTWNIVALAEWALGAEPRISGSWRWISPLLVALTIAAAVRYLATNHGWLLLLIGIIDATITFALLKQTQTLFLNAERASESLKLASILIEQWEQQKLSPRPCCTGCNRRSA